MTEAEIRDLIASRLDRIDNKISLVNTEHEIRLPDGRVSRVDILAKDHFGCFTIIEIKKSDQTARSALQQLFKYASFLKRKNRLRVDQIRCVIAATHWNELNAPFSEFKHFAEYDTRGFKITLLGDTDFTAEIADPPYEEGGGDPKTNFFFFEFRNRECREKHFKLLVDTLSLKAKSLSSFIAKVDYNGSDVGILNAFGFSWTIFQGNPFDVEDDIEKIRHSSPSEDSQQEDIDEFDLQSFEPEGSPEDILQSLLLKELQVSSENGECNGFSIHSLNNTLSLWRIVEIYKTGPIFEDNIYSEKESIELACGFIGIHPYNFVAHVSTERQSHFNFVRSRLNKYLATNYRWKAGLSHILRSLDSGDELAMGIFNPLNFFGILADLYNSGESARVPRLELTQKGKTTIQYYGTIVWHGSPPKYDFEKSLKEAYPHEELALMRSMNHWMNQYDEKLFEMYDIRHEIFRTKEGQIEILNIEEFPPIWEKSEKYAHSMRAFFKQNGALIDRAGAFFAKHTLC